MGRYDKRWRERMEGRGWLPDPFRGGKIRAISIQKPLGKKQKKEADPKCVVNMEVEVAERKRPLPEKCRA